MKSLEARMKAYEKAYKYIVTPKSYVIIRLDGKNFSKYTKNLVKPFDTDLSDAMNQTAQALCDEFNCKFAYTQSDEISLVITEIGNLEADPIFGNSLQKLCSLTASVATAKFNEVRNKQFLQIFVGERMGKVSPLEVELPKQAFFDARVFVVPNADEVLNHMIWRQQDCTRNSISMAGQSVFSHKELQGLNGGQVQEKLFTDASINWNDYPTKFKRGIVVYKETYKKKVTEYVYEMGSSGMEAGTVTRSRWKIDLEAPIFTKDWNYLMDLIPTK